jgi:NADH-quinone oxidoreductase subunit G
MREFGIENVDFRLRQTDFALDGKVVPNLGMPIAELSNLKRVLVVGSFLRKDHPLAATRLRGAVKSGAKLAIVHGSADDNLIPTANRIVAAPSDWLAALSEIAVAVAAAKGIAAPSGFEGVTAGDAAKAVAATLVVEHAADPAAAAVPGAVLLGNAAMYHPQASKLHAVAEWIAVETGAKFGYFVDAANTVGGYLVNATSKNAANLFAQPKKAYVLLNAEPDLDAANPAQAVKALKGAEMVVAMSAFMHGMDYADVLLPISPFSETAGTFVNCEGRAQSFNGTVKPLGETRPAWKVLRVLGNLLGLSGFDYENSEAIRDEALGKGNMDLSAKLNNAAKIAPTGAFFGKGKDGELQLERLADVPIYFADAVARRSEPLLRTADGQAPVATISAQLAEKLGINAGDQVTVSQGQGSAVLMAAIDARLPANVVRVAAAHESTSVLGDMFGPINVAKA